MKVNLGIVQQFTKVDLETSELVSKVNAQLGGVEEVIDIVSMYKDAVIVRVVSCKKHANADKLSVCMVDVGKNELVKVVCGAPNVHADMWAIWLPPESTVPASFNDSKPFVLDAREIRGEMSHGMLAAADELAIGSDHSGIIELSDSDIAPGSTVDKLVAGQKFAEAFGLTKETIDIENKMFTHRPDLFGQLGVAREIAGIQNKAFVSPDWYAEKPIQHSVANDRVLLRVNNETADTVPRFMVAAMSGVKVAQSPMWLQAALVAMGSKPINNVVDVTNYVMLMTAQPTHAYDYDTLDGSVITARMARNNESVKLLNGKTYDLTEDDIVIADRKRPIGLAGIMGGLDTEVSDKTSRIVLEVANFDMYTVRKSSMKHGLFTDALTRFNKGQSPYQNHVVMNYLVSLMQEICGAVLVSEVADKGSELPPRKAVITTDEFINERLGSKLSLSEICSLLENVEFSISTKNNKLAITPPFWRTDIELPEDIVEEVGRLWGFDNLPHEMPQRPTNAVEKNKSIETKSFIRETMKRLGANELLTYSFVHERVIKHAEQNIEEAYKIYNALSPELQYYRLSILPSLLDKVHMNIKAGHDSFVLYEIGKGHNKSVSVTAESLPAEQQFVDVVYASKKLHEQAAFYVIRRYAEQLLASLGAELVCKKIATPRNDYLMAPFDHARSALLETQDGVFIGVAGELKSSVIKNFKLPETTAAMSLDFVALQKLFESQKSTYIPLSRYPSITQDLSLKVGSKTTYESVYELVTAVAGDASKEIRTEVYPLNIYAPKDESTTKTITLRLRMTSYERTLTDKDAGKILNSIEKKAATALHAERT